MIYFIFNICEKIRVKTFFTCMDRLMTYFHIKINHQRAKYFKNYPYLKLLGQLIMTSFVVNVVITFKKIHINISNKY